MAKSREPGKISRDDQDEYRLPSEEGGFHVEPPEEPPRSLLKRLLSNRRLLIAVGLLVAVFIVYTFLSKTGKREEITTVEQTVKPALQQRAPEEPLQSAAVVETTNPLPDEVNALVQQSQQNQQQITQLQSGMQQIQGSVSELGRQVASMNNTVSALGQAPVASKCVIPPVSMKVVAPVVRKPKLLVYYVKAAVPGRAWLEATNGHLTTVAVGSRLPGYGTIVAINPYKATVGTSTGKIFRLSPKDS